MADERDEAGEAERPVQPPVIEGEAEEVRADEAAGAAEAPEAETAGAARRSRFGPTSVLVAGLILLVIAAGSWAAFTFAPRARPEATDPQFTERLQTIESANQQMLARIEELAGVLNELKGRPQQQVQSDPAELDALKQQISEINGRITTLSDALGGIESSLKTIEGGQGSQQKEIETTAQRIGEIQSQLNAEPTPQPAPAAENQSALAAALVKLKAAVSEGRPFAQELQSLNALAPGVKAAAGLQAYAGIGVAPMADLSAKLQEALDTLRAPAAPVETAAGSGVWDSLKAKAASVISVRKIDDAKWITAAEEAGAGLEEGDLALAVKAIRGVSGDPPPQLQAWLEAAEARLASERALEDVTAEVLKKLGGGA
jgi:hypothetical protein